MEKKTAEVSLGPRVHFSGENICRDKAAFDGCLREEGGSVRSCWREHCL